MLVKQVLFVYDLDCFFCVGNVWVIGDKNFDYIGIYVFINDFVVLMFDMLDVLESYDLLMCCQSVCGISWVICFLLDYSKMLLEFSVVVLMEIVKIWQE